MLVKYMGGGDRLMNDLVIVKEVGIFFSGVINKYFYFYIICEGFYFNFLNIFIFCN